MRKYRNIKTEVDGITFDSKREAARWGELKLMERAGLIRDLKRQVAFELAPGVKFEGALRRQPALRLIVDFQYTEHDRLILEDVKGVVTDVFRIKRHLLKAQTGMDVRITA
jgi:hypothetical protein